jgi:hypothetical protein
MIRILKNFIGNSLFWTDIFFIGVHLFIGIAFVYSGLYCKEMFVSYYTSLNIPINDFQNTFTMMNWLYSFKDIENLKILGWTWVYLCLTGFSAVISILTLHETFIRLRVRMG